MAEIKITFGGQPIEGFAKDLSSALQIQAVDMRYALERQRSRILERTARGVDINEQAFAPYSENGPYYYYPAGATSARRSAIGRLAHEREGKRARSAAGRFAKVTGGRRTTYGVKFASYGAFKRSLGRSVVDLLGASAPHMLQAMVVRTPRPYEGVIGIYGNEADRAEGHNTGAGHLPKREFFGASAKDEDAMGADIEKMMAARIDKLLN